MLVIVKSICNKIKLLKFWHLMILCLPQELFSSMIVNLCLTLLPKVSIRVIEINLTTEFSNSETLKEQNLSSQS